MEINTFFKNYKKFLPSNSEKSNVKLIKNKKNPQVNFSKID